MVFGWIWLQKWTWVIVYVKVYGKIIARDLSLKASRLYRMAGTRPWTHHVPLGGTLTARCYIIIRMNSKLPRRTRRWSNHPVMWRVAGNHCVLEFEATRGRIIRIGRLAQSSPVSNSIVFSHSKYIVLQLLLGLFDSQWTCLEDWVSE